MLVNTNTKPYKTPSKMEKKEKYGMLTINDLIDIRIALDDSVNKWKDMENEMRNMGNDIVGDEMKEHREKIEALQERITESLEDARRYK